MDHVADLLLTHGYSLAEDPHEREVMRPYPPLGLLYLSAYLRREGFDVEVFDTTFATLSDLGERLASGPKTIGIYANLTTRRPVLEVIREAKSRGRTVVLGGPEPANYPEEYLRAGADVIVAGEGEQTMAELLPALQKRGPHRLQGVRGTIFNDETGAVVTNPSRPQIGDLDSLPWPDRQQIDLSRYVQVWREHHGRGSLNLITARGCPYKCRWCSHSVFGFTHRRRSYEDCVDELQFIAETYRPDQVWYADDVFTINHRWLEGYAEELSRRNLNVPFETITRADRMQDDEVVSTLARIGCRRLWIGSESGSQRVLDAMQRGVTVEQIRWAVRTARRHGIEVGMFVMWGYESEGPDDIEATVEHMKACQPDLYLTTVAYPIRDTPYFGEVEKRVERAGPWSASTDRDYQVKGRPPPEYYRQADRLLRHSVEAERIRRRHPLRASLRRLAAAQARRKMHSLHPASST